MVFNYMVKSDIHLMFNKFNYGVLFNVIILIYKKRLYDNY